MQPLDDIHSENIPSTTQGFQPRIGVNAPSEIQTVSNGQPPPWARWIEKRNRSGNQSATFGSSVTCEQEEARNRFLSSLNSTSTRPRKASRVPAKRTSGRGRGRGKKSVKATDISEATVSHVTSFDVNDTPQLDLLSYEYTWRRKYGRTAMYVSAGTNSCISHPDIVNAMKECGTSSNRKTSMKKRATITGHACHILWQKVKAAKEAVANSTANDGTQSSARVAMKKKTTGGKIQRPSVSQPTLYDAFTPHVQHMNSCTSMYINPFPPNKVEGVNDPSQTFSKLPNEEEKREYSVSSCSSGYVSPETMSLIRQLDAQEGGKNKSARAVHNAPVTSYNRLSSTDSSIVWTTDSSDDGDEGVDITIPDVPKMLNGNDNLLPTFPSVTTREALYSSSSVTAPSINIAAHSPTACVTDQSIPTKGDIPIAGICLSAGQEHKSGAPPREATDHSNILCIGGKGGLNSAYGQSLSLINTLSAAVVDSYEDNIDDIEAVARMETHTGDIIGGYQFV